MSSSNKNPKEHCERWLRGPWGGRWEEGSCAGNERTGWGLVGHSFVLCQSELVLLKGIRYSCLYLDLLKMSCEKQMLLKVGAFVLLKLKMD